VGASPDGQVVVRELLGPALAVVAAMLARVAILAVVVAACSRPEPRALPTVSSPAVAEQVATFVAAGRTPAAFVALAVGLSDVAVGTPAEAPTAELRLVSLAAPLAEAMRSRPVAEQASVLALTVWPALLAPPLTDRTSSTTFAPHESEDADEYIARLCAGPLRDKCGAVAPDERAIIVRAAAIRNADLRMHAALATCLDCDRSWERLGWTWESLDREATGDLALLRRQENARHVIASQ
jgi:hypothetical protein